MFPDSSLRNRARRDARKTISIERRDDRRLRVIAERAARGRVRHKPLSLDLGFSITSLLVTILGTGSVACRRIPISVSCELHQRRPRARQFTLKRTRWRNLKSVEAFVDMVGTI